MGSGWFGAGFAIGLIIALFIVVPLNINTKDFQIGTPREEQLLLSQVTELQAANYTLTQKDIGRANDDQLHIYYNVTEFISFLNNQGITSAYYTLFGTAGPKIWVQLDNQYYYWRAD